MDLAKLTLEQIIGGCVVFGTTIAAIVLGLRKADAERRASVPEYSPTAIPHWFFEGPINEHLRHQRELIALLTSMNAELKAQTAVLTELLDLIAPRRAGGGRGGEQKK